MNKIIDLQETSSNYWKAKYHGNYGTYTIKMETDGKDIRNFSCSCPSSYYPCKHIPIVREAIYERINNSKKEKEKGLFFEDVVRKIPSQDLQEFVIRFGLHNTSFQQAVLLKFTPLQEQSGSGHYSEIIRSALKNVDFDYDDIYDYHYESFEIDALDQWLSKAREYTEQGNYSEAVLIAKACIEEYAEWTETIDFDLDGYISEDYVYEPFEILEKAYEDGYLNVEELLGYCRNEAGKEKYKSASMEEMFDNLIMDLTEESDPESYMAMQENLLNSLSDKSSHAAEVILERIIGFYKKRGDTKTAQRVIEENLQIDSFRQDVVKKRIADYKYEEAKKLINDYIQSKDKGNYFYHSSCWDEYLLEIAQKENDIKEIRKISRKFIDKKYHSTYYSIYKSTFSEEVWPAEVEKLVKHYQKEDYFISSVANVFIAEGYTERLLAYLAKYLHVERVEQYYKHIASEFPEKTLLLFKQAIDEYMKNTGRDIYENTVRYFDSMLKIRDGEKMVKQMIDDYKTRYKNRKAMIEVFMRFSK